MKAKLLPSALLLLSAAAWAQAPTEAPAPEAKPVQKFPFTVYKEPDNARHFIPSGQIGDTGDITLQDDSPDRPHEGKACIRIEYSAQESAGLKWAGIYWQEPDFNFGTVPNAGYNLRGARRVTFWARGAKGGEKIEVKAGGIKGSYPDSFDMALLPITLSGAWKKYEFKVDDKELATVIGGFFVGFNKKDNPAGAVVYLDDILYE